jgi:hypothetical protein
MSQADLGLITDLFFLEKKLETNKKQKQSKNKTKTKTKEKISCFHFYLWLWEKHRPL